MAAGAPGRATVECAAVNRKQTEVVVLLPKELSPLEPVAREIAARAIARGRLQVTIAWEPAVRTAAGARLAAARAFHAELKKLRRELGLSGDITLDLLLRNPDIFHAATTAPQPDAARPLVEKALRAALTAMNRMRRAEGRNLRKDLAARLRGLEKNADRIARLAPRVPERHRARLLAKIRAAELPVDESSPRLLEEIALFGERCDISEEVARLRSHLEQFGDGLCGSRPVGRALDFLCQEIFRELNTMGAKAADAGIQRLVVDSKSELDKIREQLANVE